MAQNGRASLSNECPLSAPGASRAPRKLWQAILLSLLTQLVFGKLVPRLDNHARGRLYPDEVIFYRLNT